MEERWAVVGGGMLGLTLALRAAQAGRSVTVYEAAPELGGLAAAWQLGNVVWDRHYHVTLLSDSKLRAVLRELDLEREMDWVETRTGFWDGAELHSISNAIEYLRLPSLSLVDKLRVGSTIWHGSRTSDWRALERVPVEEWLVRWSGRRAFERLWRPLLAAKLGERWRESSAAFLWATIQRLYAARRTGLKREMFGYVRGGYARVLSRFGEHLEELGVDIRTGHPVEAVSPEDRGGVRVDSAGAESRTFDRVVVTAAPPLAARLCPALGEKERRALESLPYQGIVCASLLLRRPLAGFYLTYLTGKEMPFTAIVEMTAMVSSEQLQGRHLVYLPRYVDAGDPFYRLGDDDVRSVFLAGLRRVHPEILDEDVLGFRVSRVPHVFPIPTLRYSERVPGIETGVPGLSLVSSANIVNGTLNVNETVQLAETAAERLLALPAPPSAPASAPGTVPSPGHAS